METNGLLLLLCADGDQVPRMSPVSTPAASVAEQQDRSSSRAVGHPPAAGAGYGRSPWGVDDAASR